MSDTIEPVAAIRGSSKQNEQGKRQRENDPAGDLPLHGPAVAPGRAGQVDGLGLGEPDRRLAEGVGESPTVPMGPAIPAADSSAAVPPVS